jgi:hypothetical protein
LAAIKRRNLDLGLLALLLLPLAVELLFLPHQGIDLFSGLAFVFVRKLIRRGFGGRVLARLGGGKPVVCPAILKGGEELIYWVGHDLDAN